MNYKYNDRFRLLSDYEGEIRTLAKKLKYPVDDILVAIQEVGFDEMEIEEYIRDRHERSL
jgi:hypothetical protein